MIVAIIGPDGSGKTTQAKMLVDRFDMSGYDVRYVHIYDVLFDIIKPFRRVRFKKIGPRNYRSTHLNTNETTRGTVIRLFMGGLGLIYAVITYMYIYIYLSRNITVVCDRYFYQFFFDLFGNHAEKIARIFPRPKMTFFLFGSVEKFYSQMTDPIDRTFSKEYYLNLIKFYNRISEECNFIKIDASLPKDELNNLIYENVLTNMEVMT